jgi:DNA-binding protein HU-beta
MFKDVDDGRCITSCMNQVISTKLPTRKVLEEYAVPPTGKAIAAAKKGPPAVIATTAKKGRAPAKTVAAAKAAPAGKKAAPAAKEAAVPAKKAPPAKTAPQATITLRQIATKLAENHNLPNKVAESMLNNLVALTAQHLKNGDKIRLAGLGILRVRARPARMGRNPATGASIQIAASKKIAFRPAKELKEAV